MANKKGILALAGAAAGVGLGLVAQRSVVSRRRKTDPEAGERFGERRGDRSRHLDLPDGAKLFVEEVGPESSRGAIFIHGSAMRTDMWHYQLAGIRDHRLLFYDLRGHGLSQPKGDKPTTMETHAGDLEEVIERSGLDEVVIVGHSIGGMVALELAARRPDLLGSTIRGFVLANTTHRPPYETIAGGAAVARLERFARHPLDLMSVHHGRVDRLRKVLKPSDSLFLAVSYAAFGPHASARQIDFIYDMLAETETDVLFDLFKTYRSFNVTDLLTDVNVPVLVIAGTHDRITVAGASEYLAEHLPKAELKLIQGCGHMSMLERHREFNSLVGDFMDDVLGRSRADGEVER